ncbi:sensor histidine kinase [Actinomadura rupiterrae]|uniref:sensor histidine kinase n=1 Tax=Actinomadura rupiterrae TaxID=559627 RepID=UPI0020A4CC1D|nr:sensor histidine kinase [Actinomadura rupiterrae]MCP2339319.1 signal transduction histidine kinase [Actinomadura rupiterrae]
MIDFRGVVGRWRRSGVIVRDLPAALLLFAGSLLPALHGHGTRLGDVPERPLDALAVAAVALECLPLAVRRRWPTACLALVSAGFALDQLRGYHELAGTGLALAMVSSGAHLERHRRATLVVLAVAFVPLAVALDRPGGSERPAGYAMFLVALALAWGVGAWWRSARTAEAERRHRVAEASRAAERARIARELHDVVTHHVTAMVVQAEAARYLTAAPDRLDTALDAITGTGRRAISDLRHLLDLLDPDHEDGTAPPPGDLGALVEQTRQAGQPVEFTQEGEPAAPSGSAESVAFRVVQEALTNALKHAHGSPTVVEVRFGEREISVAVGTDGPGTRTASPGADGPRARTAAVGGSGRGLAGLRDRVEALGGEFGAGARAGGGFAVRARIPAGSPS